MPSTWPWAAKVVFSFPWLGRMQSWVGGLISQSPVCNFELTNFCPLWAAGGAEQNFGVPLGRGSHPVSPP